MGAARLILRDATADDAPALATIYGREVLEGVATFEETPPTEAVMAERLAAVQALGAPWLVAEIDGRVVAYAYAGAWKPRAAYRWTSEITVYVDAGFQRLGLGRALMDALIERLRALGMRRLMASITAEGEGSIALHAALGFQQVGLLSRVGYKFGRWLDVAVFQLDLDPDGIPPYGPGLSIP